MTSPLQTTMFNGVSQFYNGVIGQSLRLSVGSDYKLDRQMVTPTSVTGTICTASWWMKKSAHGTVQSFIQCRDNQASGNYNAYWSYDSGFGANDHHSFYNEVDSINVGTNTTVVPYRDPSSWYHVVIRYDSTQGTAANRIRIYKNGTLQNSTFATTSYPSQNAVNTFWNNAGEHLILFGNGEDSGDSFDGYIAEFNWVDGLSLAPESFGESKNGVWIPKAYSGAYGLNGSRYTFADSSDIGKDTSGVGNDLDRVSNLSASDVVPDSPENNFCTLNSLILTPQTTFSEGNLFANLGATHKTVHGTFGMTTGKWYWEARAFDGGANKFTYGLTDVRNVSNLQVSGTNYLLANTAATYANGDAVSIYHDSLYKNGSATGSYNTAIGDNDMVGIAFDADAGKVWFHREGTWINSDATASTTINLSKHDTTVTTGQTYHLAFAGETSDWLLNAGQDSSFNGTETAQGNTDGNGIGDFYYAVPSGFLALCSANLPELTIGPNSTTQANNHFDITLYTGNGGDKTISGFNFQPDWVWSKARSVAHNHHSHDSSRGVEQRLAINNDEQEASDGALKTFTSDGYTFDTAGAANTNNQTYVNWVWHCNAGTTTTNDVSSTGVGTIDSVIQANTTAGFSIVTYTGSGANATVAHGLSSSLDVVLVKGRSGNPRFWTYWGTQFVNSSYIYLNTNDDTDTGGATITNNTYPTDSVFSIGTSTFVNGSSETYVAYCFHEVDGYSKFGTYTGNGNADGAFVFTGFRPAYVMVKRTDADNNWVINDTTRSPFNEITGGSSTLYADTNNKESDLSTDVDFLSNGFKAYTTGAHRNAAGTYLYWAFAEAPFKYSNAR